MDLVVRGEEYVLLDAYLKPLPDDSGRHHQFCVRKVILDHGKQFKHTAASAAQTALARWRGSQGAIVPVHSPPPYDGFQQQKSSQAMPVLSHDRGDKHRRVSPSSVSISVLVPRTGWAKTRTCCSKTGNWDAKCK